MEFQFPYHDKNKAQHVIVVEAETFDEALEIAVMELWRRHPPE